MRGNRVVELLQRCAQGRDSVQLDIRLAGQILEAMAEPALIGRLAIPIEGLGGIFTTAGGRVPCFLMVKKDEDVPPGEIQLRGGTGNILMRWRLDPGADPALDTLVPVPEDSAKSVSG